MPDFLLEVGLIHRLESTRTYLPCVYPDHDHSGQYLLCTCCGNVEEVESESITKDLKTIANDSGFRMERAVVELSGRCRNCLDCADQ